MVTSHARTRRTPDELDARLRHEAARRGTTLAQLTREALEAHLALGPTGRRRLLATKSGRSGQADVSEQIEAILRQELRP